MTSTQNTQNELLTPEEKAFRHKCVDQAIHSQRLEGGDVSEDVQADLRLYAEGHLTFEEGLKRALKKHTVKA
ncbi:hypothetical protein E3E11_02680 [Oecophyllibacter saccharovorans]|uniref:antitoxin VbhA family protein n=1 Tax=Oecophyllibacter saccharovorans TaxID=2558360 RepID=UPI001141411A|nr:antitoxin VbhA family protein [Oecophyllibacter saccharovorans]QDH14946.1 hypothetical protein E3E11_02680 [Oecophyllibacter saccharovorans]